MHIFFNQKMGDIPEANTPLALTVYSGPKHADSKRSELSAIRSFYYLMPGDDQKTRLFAKVIEGMTSAMKHLRYLHIYAGFDDEFS